MLSPRRVFSSTAWHGRFSAFVASVILFGAVASPARASFPDWARAGEWQRILDVASRRVNQLPLSPEEAMVAARAARVLGDHESERRFLSDAASGSNPKLARLAEVQLAGLIGSEDASRVIDLAMPALARDNSYQLREAAVEIVMGAVAVEADDEQRAALEAAEKRLPSKLRRELELAMALSDEVGMRSRLDRLLASSTRDLVALRAAEALLEMEAPTAEERWSAAETLYRHAMYTRAEPILEGLLRTPGSKVPAAEVAFLRGRCAFRRDRWGEAIQWYREALDDTRRADRRAELEVHIARTFELAGDLEKAVEHAQRAIRSDTTDDRRLFLARLRFRRDEPDLAAQGISRLRGRSNRARGEVMLAVDSLRHGDRDRARSRLVKVRRRPWSGPAAVIAADLALAGDEPAVAVDLLNRMASILDPFWAEQARGVMSGLPPTVIELWRRNRVEEVAAAEGSALWRALGRWAVLEPEREHLRSIRKQVVSAAGFDATLEAPVFEAGLAADLWRAGLESDAARWDPSDFPRGDAEASAWSAARFLDFGLPWRAVRVADGAWRQAGSQVPMRAFPQRFQSAFFPLPDPDLVHDAAKAGGVEWSLLAAVAREESRWDPGALSAVGARGLVQLMPATAASVAARLGLAKPAPEDLFQPRTSLTLGGAELGRLVAAFGGRWAPAVAAYNAGEVQARLWLDQCGPECSEALYLANISFSSTRRYTAAVLAAATAYAELFRDGDSVGD